MSLFSTYCKDSSLQSEGVRSAYNDWEIRGRPADTLLAFRDHHGPDCHIGVYLRPDVNILRVDADYEFYDFALSVEIEVDPGKSIVRMKRLLCSNSNHWPELMDARLPLTGSGGISRLVMNERCLDEISLEKAVATLFGPTWMAVRPLTVPRISDVDLARADACDAMYRAAMAEPWFPWGRTIGMYDTRRTDAAVQIQRHFRGWRVRLRIAFNPNTPLGAYYALRLFYSA